jgi:curved DNA-binding protein
MDHYSTLGVDRNATADEIKQAYRKLASKHHPDKGGDTATFQRIQEAYAVLSDPERRQQHDNPGFSSEHFHFTGGDDIHDILRNFGFNFGMGGRPNRPRKNQDLRVRIEIDLASTADSQTKILSVRTATGERSTLNITIPRGVSPGSVIKYPELGDHTYENLPRGDLYAEIYIVMPPDTAIANDALHQRLELDVLDAITGVEREVTTPYLETVTVSIPPGLRHGSRIRLRERGLYHQSGARGDLFLSVELTVPRNLSERQLELIQQAKQTT